MCMHDKPTRNSQCTYGIEGRAPALLDGDTLIYDEEGRCSPQINGNGSTDYHSHHLRMVSEGSDSYCLLVRHGAGDERIDLGYGYRRLRELLAPMDSDSRYLMLYALYSVHKDAARKARDATNCLWEKAAAEKRIKTRKARGGSAVKVWIESEGLS